MDVHSAMKVEIQKLHDTELQLSQALTFLSQKAQDADLREALIDHRTETDEHARRLEQICNQMGWQWTGQPADVTRALVQETQNLLTNAPLSPITDACIIAAAQKAEHLEIAMYGTAVAWADEMDHSDAKHLLKKTLGEEQAADHRLSRLAEHGINAKAVEMTPAATVR